MKACRLSVPEYLAALTEASSASMEERSGPGDISVLMKKGIGRKKETS
jgi:hypothetical protein